MRKAMMAGVLLATTGTLVSGCAALPQSKPPRLSDLGGVQQAEDPALSARAAKFAAVSMTPDTSFLSAEERQVVNLLIEAADLMSVIYLRQAYAANPELRAQIAASDDPRREQLLDLFDLNFGVWDSLAENEPFYGSTPLPDGAGFYPTNLTKADFDAYLAAHPAEKARLIDPYTVVRRQGDRLVAVPYSEAYAEWLKPASRLLQQAAAITSNASLRRFLSLRAEAFASNDYYPSELAWMDLTGTPIEPVIGPYEVYTDRLYGQKTAFEAFITLKDPQQSAALNRYKALLPALEANLPVPAKYKNANRPFNSPILVAEQVRGGGDNVPGVQTIAFNLPNDERVRSTKGAKKVILSNVLGAKYDRILAPMAERVLVSDQADKVVKKYMTQETLFHELAHSLGPGIIKVGGRDTTVNAELRDQYSASEEAKADVMGAFNLLYLMRRGELPMAEREQLLATYFAGIFRAVRFGIDEAHGRGAALQYSYLREKGAFAWDASAARYRIDYPKMEAGIGALVTELVRRQGDGDYAGMKAFFDRYAKLDANAQAVLATLVDIPTDIRPNYPERI